MSDSPTPRPTPDATTDAAVDADKYAQMLALADFFDRSGSDMRERARLGTAILTDPDVLDTAELSQGTFAQAEEDIRAATTGKQGLLTRSVELDADALVVRATVLTYRWIDELQAAAFKTLGSIAGRAIGYLAPEVALGGAIVSAGLIETDSLDRDGVAAYLNELADNHPELMDHLTDGGGLLEGLAMRSLLTAGVMSSDSGAAAARGGLRAIGVAPFPADSASALRDAAAGFAEISTKEPTPESASDSELPSSIEDLMVTLTNADRRISVQRIGAGRYIAYLPGNRAHEGGRLRLVGNDNATYVRQVVRAIEQAVEGETSTSDPARVMLVGSSYGGAAAAEIASAAISRAFVVDQVVTAGAPAAQVPSIPEQTRVLSLEDRADPVALLGSLINADVANRVTVVYDGDAGSTQPYVAGGRAADEAQHPGLRAEIKRIQELGYLAG
ncbi:hypothetical protein [Nocardioides currus]|uniref:GPI inositol-deacylase PGAP1-like alpha/beta domain-containing protein n=1 Tax=Nocardioides currus TaxID=2133958 RepID=A0A2R7Z2S7_9ACTN|nr:hypothetical protein [Nocardioides currus]PUA82900.1 hypothetical protein C7S10_04140 [Nocardioides currus]